MDQLIIHFMNSVHQESFAVILEQVEVSFVLSQGKFVQRLVGSTLYSGRASF